MAEKHTRFPETWNDDARMTVLFAPFRDKSLNPSSWDQKMTFWSNLIVSDCTICGDIVIDVKTLPCRFQRNGKTPACLSSVVDEMERTGKLKQVADTEMSPSNQGAARKGWMSWGMDTFIKAPISMGWNLMTKPTISSTKLVVVEALKSKCEEVCRLQCACMDCDITDSVIEYSELWDRCRELCKTEGEFYLVLKELDKEKRIMFYHTDTCLLVKFPQRSESTAGPVTEQDIQIYSMKKASKVLLDRIEKLGKDVDRLTVEAKMHKRKDMKQYALRSLRQRRRTQNRMSKLSGSLDMIDDVLSRIQHAASDEMVLKALQAGSGALKTLTDRTGLDEVHRTMDNLAEVLDHQNEIESEMNMSRIGDVSSEDLERELESLIGEHMAPPQGDSVVSPEKVNVSPPRGAPITISPENDVLGIADLLAGLDFGSPSGPTQSKQAGSSYGLNQSKPIGLPSNDMADTTTKLELSNEIFDLDFPDVPNFSPGTPEKSNDRQKTWTKLPQKEAEPS
ncbi:charged multivesicular body protein 7-like [Mizuhopecten yessoensis]|uniref:Charged multivesicular body protein 7 n=1 Tax=Mizuhopecten yessoensis TaxID=6573 RepID=A0A210PPE5_MIZYE|nr:charged multivesicular body protein 7-like [Mizuhopecten yessoensis]OWF38352.1 Charged multivesicular body protein 7 [Mizuhopecten yessoensis]